MPRTALVAAPLLAIALALPAAAQQRLLVLNKADHTMSIVDPVAMKVIGTVPVGRGPHEAVASADGRTGYVANYGDQQANNSISIVDIASMKETRRVDLGALARPKRFEVFGVPLGIQMAPDGKRAYIARAQANRVDALDLDKLEFVGSVETGKGPDGLAYSVVGG
jgi:YVTN family beta-propeller protein